MGPLALAEKDAKASPKRPPGEATQRLAKGLKRSARGQESLRAGCRGAEAGRKQARAQEEGWAGEQAKLTHSSCGATHAAWQARYGAAPGGGRKALLGVAAGGLAPGAEPLAAGRRVGWIGPSRDPNQVERQAGT